MSRRASSRLVGVGKKIAGIFWGWNTLDELSFWDDKGMILSDQIQRTGGGIDSVRKAGR